MRTFNEHLLLGEFIAFETTLNLPDSMFRVAFQLFDQNGSGTISVHNFKELMERVDRSSEDFPIPPFNFDSEYVKLFFGSDLKHEPDSMMKKVDAASARLPRSVDAHEHAKVMWKRCGGSRLQPVS